MYVCVCICVCVCVCVCVCEREREREREREKEFDDADGAACVAAAANDDAIAAAAYVDADLAAHPAASVAASGAAPRKANKQCSHPRSPYHFGRRSPRRHCPFSSSSSSFLLDPVAATPVAAVRQSRVA